MIKRILDNRNLKVGGVYLIANIINKAIAFITIPIFSRMLSTGEYGIVSTYLSFVMILQYLMGLSSEYTVRNAYVDFEKEIPQYMSAMYLLTCFCSLGMSIIIVALNGFGLHLTTTMICLCCVIQSFMTYVNNAISNKLMMDEAYIKRAVITAVPNLLSVILGIVFIIMLHNDKVLGRVLGYVIAISVFGLCNLIGTWKVSKPRLINKYWKYILKISPPLIIHGLSIIILSQLDRIMITSMHSSAETGIYSIIYSLSMVATAITAAIESVWTPWFTTKYIMRDFKSINKRAYHYLLMVSIMIFGIMFIAPEVLKIMTPEDYWRGINMIPPLVVTSFFIYMYSFCVNLELLEKKTKRIAAITLTSAVVNVILNYIFIPHYGALAAAGTTLVSYVVAFLLHFHYGKKICRNLFPIKMFVLPVVILVLASIVFYFTLNFSVIRWILATVIVGVVICKFGSTLKNERTIKSNM